MNTTTNLPKSLAGEYACLFIHNEEYGVRTSQVKAVVDIPIIRMVPKAPAFVEGVANIEGRIIPLLNPVERFGLSNSESIDNRQSKQSTINNQQSSIQGRLVLIQLDNSLYGVMVDGISSITYLTEEMIEPINPLMVQKEAPFIGGMAKYGERLIYLLDTDAFITTGILEDQERRDSYELFSARMSEELERGKDKKFRRFLALSIGDEEYGLDSAGLKELIPASRMEESPGGPGYLAGIVKTAESIIPVVDLQKKFNLDHIPYTDRSRVAIVGAGEFDYGILANSATEFLNITDDEIKETPAVISGDDSGHIKGVGMLDGGERLVVLLDKTRILDDKEVKTLAKRDDIKMYQKGIKKKPGKGAADLTFVVFRVLDMEFAFNLEDLSEIIQYKEATRVPKAPQFIRGVVSVSGELVPVVDLRKRFDLSKGESDEETRIIVIKKEDALSGIVADSVSEILRVPKKDIFPAPKIVKGVDSRFIDGIIRIEKTDRAPIVLNIEEVLTGGEPTSTPKRPAKRSSPKSKSTRKKKK